MSVKITDLTRIDWNPERDKIALTALVQLKPKNQSQLMTSFTIAINKVFVSHLMNRLLAKSQISNFFLNV